MQTTLTDRQERFVHEYLIDQNASAAAQRAGYSAKTKGTQSVDLMKNPLVKERVVQELADLYARLKVTALDTLKAQVAAAYLDPAKLFDGERGPVPLDELDEETKLALTVNYEQRRNGEWVLRVRQTPRHVALAALVKRMDAFERLRAEVEREAEEVREEALLEEERLASREMECQVAGGLPGSQAGPVARVVPDLEVFEARNAQVLAQGGHAGPGAGADCADGSAQQRAGVPPRAEAAVPAARPSVGQAPQASATTAPVPEAPAAMAAPSASLAASAPAVPEAVAPAAEALPPLDGSIAVPEGATFAETMRAMAERRGWRVQ